MTGIPYVRYVDYTDDGCSIYQCLACKGQWESRSAPYQQWTREEPKLEWNYCPLCGVKWKGAKIWDTKTKWDRKCGRPRDPQERLKGLCYFVVMKRFTSYRDGRPEGSGDWKFATTYADPSAPAALRTRQFYLDQEKCSNDQDRWAADELGRTEFKIVTVSSLPEHRARLVQCRH